MITFKNIQIKYDDFVAIPDLTFDVKEGEFFTLLGPSGCGKTTTLRALAGFLKTSHGVITIDDKDITDVPVHERQVGMVFQSYALFPSMSAYENIAFGLKVEKQSKDYIKKRVAELAEMVDLTKEQLAKNVSNMSGGQQQRVAIARALARKPKILVMDEPLSNLDAKLRKSLRKDIRDFQKKYGITMVYVTHDQEEALMLSDRIAVFSKGQIDQIGTPNEIYNHSATEFVCKFIGDANYFSKTDLEKIGLNPSHFGHVNKFYIRPEKVYLSKEKQSLITGRIISKEFYGMYAYYKIEVNGVSFLSFQSESTAGKFEVGDEVSVFINLENILNYADEVQL
ncbi:ABC transporter ATP-binding protein [Companilactobacillus nantensis]|uniref:ABC transporter, ATP-binding protein n=1 Tax=Companilactobacillus nantensis DSM 16982 TaxID=1423774 RepID=A0A0R1WLA0_9LACO|nr:ABC transporter ATP-binding protein [Companilactobacillus nantensis]KRM18642.1 ABC transporter, ATP-binding protein [Companilactobacillus nantensis DSM 16982]GEO63171.1 ABC transporter ATP-binding protein [Companilactobacillus nantensis]